VTLDMKGTVEILPLLEAPHPDTPDCSQG